MPFRWQTIVVLALIGLSGVAYRPGGGGQESSAINVNPSPQSSKPEAQLPPSPRPTFEKFRKDHLPDDKKVDFLFATVPDPEDPHLALEFDRAVESILRAVEDAYAFDSSWLPWTQEPVEGDWESMQKQLSQRRQLRKDPGLLLFRRSDVPGASPPRGLAVVLIAETPESGADREEFEKALTIAGGQFNIPVLGPTFSGSFASLAELMKPPKFWGISWPTKHSFSVVSGTATDEDLEDDFTRKLPALHPSNRYSSVVHSDLSAFCALRKYLREQLGAGDDTIAILSEEATSFGSQFKNIDRVMSVRYPRGISRIREAYPEGASAERSSVVPPDVPTLLHLKGRNEPPSLDVLPTFAAQQTLASQEAVLLDLAATLVREKTKFAVVVATNILDEVLLAQFLRRHVYDIRLCFLDADLLFVHGFRDLPLDGVLSVTTYPLHNRNQYWTSGRAYQCFQRRVAFPSQDAEGVYNACRALLWDYSLREKAKTDSSVTALLEDPLLLDYSWENDQQPPLWLSVIGRDAYYPIAHLKRDPKVDKFLYKRDDAAPVQSHSGQDPCRDSQKGPCQERPFLLEPNPPSVLWTVQFFTLLIAGFCFSFLIQRDWFARRYPGVGWLQRRWTLVLSLRPGEEQSTDRLFYVTLFGLSFVVVYLLFALPLAPALLGPRNSGVPVNLPWNFGPPGLHRWITAMVYPFFPLVLLVSLLWRILTFRCDEHKRLNRVVRVAPLVVVMLGATAVSVILETNQDYGGNIFMLCVLIPGGVLVYTLWRILTFWRAKDKRWNRVLWVVYPVVGLFLAGTVWSVIRVTNHQYNPLDFIVSVVVPGGLLIFMLRRILTVGCDVDKKKWDWVLWVGFLLIGFLMLVGVVVTVICETKHYEGFFFLYRSLQSTSGVSPALPLMIMAAAVCYLAWVHFQRLAFFVERRPDVPDLDPLSNRWPDLWNRIDRRTCGFFVDLREWIPALLLFGLIFATVFNAFYSWRHPQTLELAIFEYVLDGGIWLLCMLIYFTWTRLLYLWAAVRDFLHALECHPLRRAFSNLPKEYSWSPVWQSGGTRRTFTILSRQRECLRAIIREVEPAFLPSLLEGQRGLEGASDAFLEKFGRGEAQREWKEVQRNLDKVCKMLVSHLRELHWSQGSSDSCDELRKRKAGEETTEDERAELARSRPVVLMEEFLALQYVSYIRYAFLQLRNLLSFVACGFILLVALLYSYPFQARQLFGLIATLAFLILGTGVVLVFMQMDRDPLLSRISNTTPGRLDRNFFLRLADYGALPLLALLAAQVPAVGNFVNSLVEPVLKALH